MSGRPDSFMPMFWGDYLKDTGHLTAAEHGAYLMLIAHYWTSGKPLPASDEQLRRIARMTTAEWRRSRPTIAAFFLEVAGQWTHKRVVAELEHAAERYERRSRAGRRGNEKRWANGRETIAMRSQCDPPAVPMRSQPQPQPHKDPVGSLGEARKPRGSRLPDDWQLSRELREFAFVEGLDRPEVEAEKFRDYWHARAGPNGVKLDWDATWRNWVRRAIEDGRGGGGPNRANGRGSGPSDRDRLNAAIADAIAPHLGSGDGPAAAGEPGGTARRAGGA